jgi:Sec-independent protein translocase protein TatA
MKYLSSTQVVTLAVVMVIVMVVVGPQKLQNRQKTNSNSLLQHV